MLDAAPQQIGVHYIGLLTVWRYTDSFVWGQTWADNVGKLRSTTTGTARMFWDALAQKKVGLFGYGHDTDADPMALIRHPWSLRKVEFEQAYATVVTDKAVPTNIPDDVSRFRQICEWGGTFAAGVGAGLAFSNPLSGAVVGVAGAAVGGGAIFLDWKDGLREDSEKRHLLADIAGYAGVYRREAEWRRRETI